MNSFKQFVCLSGLPRTGSTLLSALLSQNPAIHAEGNSAVCQLMWDTQQSCLTSANQQLVATNRQFSTMSALMSQIPHIYYQGITEQIVVDKCRSWTLLPNIEMLRKYVDANIKIIVMERPIREIVASFIKLYRKNGWLPDNEVEQNILKPNSEPIMRSIAGINWAKKNNQNNTFIFISYRELVTDPAATLDKIYAFCGWTPFAGHDYINIVSKYPENDAIYKLDGQHFVRSSIGAEIGPDQLSNKLQQQCKLIDDIMGLGYCI